MYFFRNILAILILHTLFSCEEKSVDTNHTNSAQIIKKIDTTEVSMIQGSPCYGIDSTYLFISDNGTHIRYTKLNKLEYQILWGLDSTNLRVLPDTFYCDAPTGSRPRFIDENDDYILLENRCGNPCWQGFFLPLNESREPEIIGDYYDYDLSRHLVAYPAYDSDYAHLVLKNLHSNQSQTVELPKNCSSPIEQFCIDSVSIGKDELFITWNSELNGSDGQLITKRIKLQ